MDTIIPLHQSLNALLAIVSSEYFLREELGLFAGQSVEFTSSESSYAVAMKDTIDWCMRTLHACGWAVSDGEAFADEVTLELLDRARAAVDALQPRGVEALYLSALALIVDDFCTLWETFGRACSITPLPHLHNALTGFLLHDYHLDLAAPGTEGTAVLAGARQLESRWLLWAEACR